MMWETDWFITIIVRANRVRHGRLLRLTVKRNTVQRNTVQRNSNAVAKLAKSFVLGRKKAESLGDLATRTKNDYNFLPVA
jgi:hypothetical protein